MPANVDNGRNLGAVASELKEEFKEFASTRLSMLQSEMREKIATWKSAAPMVAVGVVMLVTAWLLVTAAIVAAIYMAFRGSPWAMFAACGIVGVAYLVIGGMAVMMAVRNAREAGLVPTRTLRVLKDDQLWISNETRAQV